MASSQEHWLFLQRTQFPAPTWGLILFCSSSSQGSSTLLWYHWHSTYVEPYMWLTLCIQVRHSCVPRENTSLNIGMRLYLLVAKYLNCSGLPTIVASAWAPLCLAHAVLLLKGRSTRFISGKGSPSLLSLIRMPEGNMADLFPRLPPAFLSDF